MDQLLEIEIPSSTAYTLIETSTPILTQLKMMDEYSWEDMTLELASVWKKQYTRVLRCGGSGDMGRDVVAYSSDDPSIWENFQCKHYFKPISLADALLEVGKSIYYSYKGEFTLPKKYYFVCPTGISSDLLNHLMNTNKLKAALISRWDKNVKKKITKTEEVELSEELKSFINSIDFSIFDHLPQIKIIELHQKTVYHERRFGKITYQRPKVELPPTIHQEKEIPYISELKRAFEDDAGEMLSNEDILADCDYFEEYISARKNFYSAENLEKFSRDWLPQGSYGELLDQCYESISPLTRSRSKNGFEKYLEVSSKAASDNYTHPLSRYTKVQDKKGMCHQLVNNDRVKWVKK